MTATSPNDYPASLNDERCLLSVILNSMVFDKDALPVAMDLVEPEIFYSPQNAIIFSAMRTLYRKKVPVSIESVISYLEKSKEIGPAGGHQYLWSLQYYTGYVAPESVIWHTKILVELAYCRAVAKDSEELKHFAMDGKWADLHDYFTQFKEKTEAYEKEYEKPDDFVAELRQHRQDIDDGKKKAGVKTGLIDLDNIILDGLPYGYPAIIQGDTGVGKTALLLQILDAAVCEGERVALFSLEMQIPELWPRVVGARLYRMGYVDTNFNYSQVRSTNRVIDKNPEWWAIEGYREGWYIERQAGLTTQKILKKSRQYIKDYGVTVIAIDHLGLLALEGKAHPQQLREAAVSQMVQFAKDNNIVLIWALQRSTQASREGKKDITAAQVHYFTTAPQAAATQLSIYKPAQKDNYFIVVNKSRCGMKGLREYQFLGGVQTFRRPEGGGYHVPSGEWRRLCTEGPGVDAAGLRDDDRPVTGVGEDVAGGERQPEPCDTGVDEGRPGADAGRDADSGQDGPESLWGQSAEGLMDEDEDCDFF